MQCVEIVTFATSVNGVPRGRSRGIRQGDSLSPYMFILCTEVLSHLLSSATSQNKLKGMKISVTGPTITTFSLQMMHYSFAMLIHDCVEL